MTSIGKCLCDKKVVILIALLVFSCNWRSSYASWGWLMIGNWSAAGFTLPCEYQTCIQVPQENTTLQLATYRCRGEVWWQEQFTYQVATKQLTTQPRYGPLVCVDIMPNTTVNVGVAPCNATSKTQRWLFVGTKIQNEANSLFLQVQPVSGFYLTTFAGASLNVSVGPQQAGYISDFTLMDSSVLRSYKPPLPTANATVNLVQNGLFGMNWREPLGLEAADTTEICRWKIMADIDLNSRGDSDVYGWNVQLNAGPQHVNRHGQLGAISQLVPTFPNRQHTLLFQGSGLKDCGGTVKNVTVSIVPSSVNFTTVSIPAGKGWQLQQVDFNTTSDFVNLTLSSASDEGSFCGPNVTDVKLGLKGAFDGLLPKKKSVLTFLDAGLMGALVMMVGVQLGVIAIMRTQLRRLAKQMPDGDVNVVPKRFSFRQIVAYTMNFQEKIGEGGFSTVYLGSDPNSMLLAVKRNKRPEFAFFQEVDMLSRVHHRRIVRFVGYCAEKNEQILVSEYMENGSLYDMLHLRAEGGHILRFEQRVRIVRDVALGLEYLHHGASPGIIHRDIKSANVLLDNRLSAKLADFGCFKEGHDNTFSINSSLETTNYRGTFGYMDPTCATCLTVSTKSDVYSFGVLILELVTGRRAMDVHFMIQESRMPTPEPAENQSLTPTPSSSSSSHTPRVPRPLTSPAALSIIDPLMPLDTTADIATLQLLVSTAYLCLNPVRDERPSMIEVVRLLGPAEAFEDSSADTPVVVSVSPGGTAYSSHDNSLIPLVNRSVQHSFFTQGR